MAEQHLRCSFFPRCAIHLGWVRPRFFSKENKNEMREMYFAGVNITEIAGIFEATRHAVAPIVQVWKDKT